MLPQHVLLALAAAVSAVPLNINLGAYSPALVVGDGEISLGSTASASELMSTLASGAANGQAKQGQQQQGEQQQQQQEQQQQQQNQEQPAEGEAAKRAPNLVRTIDHLGKRSPVPEAQPEAAPAEEDRLAAVEDAMQWIKRDLAGFREALTYAREAMQNTPKIELGSENAGVGIIVNPGLNVPANSAANGKPAGEKKNKRSEVVAEESEAPRMTLVAITEV